MRGNVEQFSSLQATACSRLQFLELQSESAPDCLEGNKHCAFPELRRHFCCGDLGANCNAIRRPQMEASSFQMSPVGKKTDIAIAPADVRDRGVSGLRFSPPVTLARSEGNRCPTGKSTKTCPAPSRKIFRFRRRANQRYQLAPSFPGKRAYRDRHERGRGCGGRFGVGAKRCRRASLS